MGEYKTPGVYIKEKNAFGNSVVEAETAIPAFIGYTETAMNGAEKDKPQKISSMTEFVKYFGGAPKPTFKVEIKPFRYLTAQQVEAKKKFKDDEKMPDGLFVYANHWCEEETEVTLKDKDDHEIQEKEKVYIDYALTVNGENTHTLYYQMQMFFANGGGTCYIVSVGHYDQTTLTENAVVTALNKLKKTREVTMVIVPEAVSAGEAYSKIQQQVMKHCGEMANRFAILDVLKDSTADGFLDGATDYPSYGAAYYPWLNTSVLSSKDIDETMFEWDDSVFKNGTRFIKTDATLIDILVAFCGEKKVMRIKKDETLKYGSTALNFNEIIPKCDDFLAITKVEEVKVSITSEVTEKTATIIDLLAKDLSDAKALYQSLCSASSLFKQIIKTILANLNLLSPSAAMAGVYTKVDSTRGVWKAPANVALNYVESPMKDMDDDEQADMNVPINGIAVNAIRNFPGEGVKVWGGRTFDGNSNDWRYINVRRTLLFLEESVKNAARAYVFEPNDAGTWINMKCMIESFLRSVWKRGGLAGATPEDAFEVHVGLGDTMTGEDILEGIMRISVLVAVSHPAEFIEITFQQQMQKS